MTNERFPFQDFHLKDLSWLTILLAILTIWTLIAVSSPGVRYGRVEYSTGSGTIPPMMSARDGVVTGGPSVGMPGYYPYPNPEVPVTDMREYLKMYYSATLQTRDAQALTHRVETTVRGHGGRIDQQSSSPKYGYVSFAIPQNKFDAFRTELENFVDSRFLAINISTQNLLSQKVSIEEQQKQATTALADYKSARQKLVSAHAGAVQALQAKMDAEGITASELASLTQQLANENASYTAQLSAVDENIKYAQQWLKAVQTQDKTLLESVATVTGTVSIQWISLWDMAQAYLPGYWIPAIFAALTVLSYLRDRRRLLVVTA